MPALKNHRWELFAMAIASGMTQAAAYESAGYKGKTRDVQDNGGARLLNKAQIAERVIEIKHANNEQRFKMAAISRVWVLQKLQQVADRCMRAEPVLDKQGNKTGEYRFNAAGANKALELIGRELSMFQEFKQLPGQQGANIGQINITYIQTHNDNEKRINQEVELFRLDRGLVSDGEMGSNGGQVASDEDIDTAEQAIRAALPRGSAAAARTHTTPIDLDAGQEGS